MSKSEIKVKSLYKALKVFECFKADTPELGITEISEILDLNKSNVHNIISTFEYAGYLEKNEKTGKYKLGLKILEFAFVINENLGYQRAVYKILEDISKKIDAVVYFTVPKGGDIIYLSATYPDSGNYDYPVRSIMGEKAPMHCTAVGKAILAFMSPEVAEQYIVAPKVKFTENTITDTEQLRKELEFIRQRGYSIDNIEHEYGIKCVGVPVFNSKGHLVAGLSASGIAISFTNEKIEEYSKILRQASYEMRDRL